MGSSVFDSGGSKGSDSDRSNAAAHPSWLPSSRKPSIVVVEDVVEDLNTPHNSLVM